MHTLTRSRVRPAVPLLATLLAAVLVVLTTGLTGAATGATGAPATANGWVRAGHLSPGTPTADVRLAPYAGGRTQTLSNVSFGQLTDYTRVPAGLYTVSLVRAGSPMKAAPMISQNVRVTAGGASTVIATGSGADVRASVLSDDLTPPPAGRAKVRLLSGATDPDAVDASVVAGPTLAQDVTTGSSTGYADVAAQTWSIELAGSDGQDSVVRRVPVKAGGVYTLVALNTAQGALDLKAVQDSGSSTSATGSMPTGGVDTGGGGLARASSPTTVLDPLPATVLGVVLATVLAGALVGARAGSTVLARRRRAAA